MKYRAVIKKSGKWWIGWLIDLPGVNAQEKTKAELIKSLRVGAEDMLDTEVPFELDAEMTMIDISDPTWTKAPIENLTAS
jgi:predicted RNase H-like HicB family nuclease